MVNREIKKSMDANSTDSNNNDSSAPNIASEKESMSKKIQSKPLLVFVVFVSVMALFASGAAAYNALVLNNPDRIWNQSMNNTANALRELSQSVVDKSKSGGTVEGSFNLVSPMSLSGTINGKWYEQSAELTGQTNIAGLAIRGETRVIASENSELSDVFTKIDGLDRITPFLSTVEPEIAAIMSLINGNWYVLDSELQSELLPSEQQSEQPKTSPEELSNLSQKLSTVVLDRLFSGSSSDSIIEVKEAVGREDFEGDDTYKYAVAVRKEEFIQFISELNNQIEGSQIDGLLLKEYLNSSSAEDRNIKQLIDGLYDIDFSAAQAEVWVKMDRKLFRNVRVQIPTEENVKTYIDFGLDYEGTVDLPFSLRFYSNDLSGETENTDISLSATINRENLDIQLGFSINNQIDGQKLIANGQLIISQSSTPVEVKRPDNAKSIKDIFELFMLNDALAPSTEKVNDNNVFNFGEVAL
jgi:hypothetical protein